MHYKDVQGEVIENHGQHLLEFRNVWLELLTGQAFSGRDLKMLRKMLESELVQVISSACAWPTSYAVVRYI